MKDTTAISTFENPWDEKPRNQGRGNNEKDDLDAIMKKAQEKISDLFGGGSGGGQSGSNGGSKFMTFTNFIIVSLIALVSWLASGFYTVNTDEVAVVLRFGNFDRFATPGLNYKLPVPIETMEKVSTTRVRKENVGFNPAKMQSAINRANQPEISIPKESLMLTADENIIDMHFFVQWHIKDARKFLFNIKDARGENTVRTSAESAVRQVVGTAKLSEALSERRHNIELKAKEILQQILDSYDSGIEVSSLGILYSYVAPEVRDAYRDIQSAKADHERLINQAYAYKNELLPKAQGEAQAIIQRSLGYKEKVIAEAKGQSERFQKILDEYSKAKDVTIKRLYIQTMEELLGNTDKIIVDEKFSSSMLPLLPLNEMMKNKSSIE